MQYLNPVSLLGITLQTPLDTKTIQRERKKLLAELELSGGESLELNGRRFTKNELLAYFDELERENIAGYHLAVLEDAVLIKFLQTGEIDQAAAFNDAAIYSDQGFIAWLSPYFYSTFVTYITRCFDHPNAAAMRTILNSPLLMTSTDKERAWHFITAILEKNIALFEHYKNRYKKNSPRMMRITRIMPILESAYLDVIRELPDNRFAALKDKYAFSIQYPAVATFNRDGRHAHNAARWLEDAEQLAVSQNLKTTIHEKAAELGKIQKTTGNRTQKSVTAFIVIGLIVIGFAYKMLSGASSTFTPDPQQAGKTPDSTTSQMDSIAIRMEHKIST